MYRFLLAAVLMTATLANAAPPQPTYPLILPAPHGSVILPTQREKQAHDDNHYAAARRVDNMLYVSGVIVGRLEGEGNDVAAFKVQARRAFERLKATLTAAGATFADVVMVNSFHVWEGPNFAGTRDEQFGAFRQVSGEFFSSPYPAWTAVGTTGLLFDGGIVEVQLIVRLPKQAP
jgi:enamine deaminase RidA (YjgF/YER057c/UK114 family)